MTGDGEDPAEPQLPEELNALYRRLPDAWKASLWGKHLLARHQERRLPPAVYLELTNACNLNCVMCPTQRESVRRHRADGFMEPALFRRLVDEIAAADPHTRVGLHKDGEPLLHPRVVELVAYATARLDNVTLVTNGTLMTEDLARGLLGTRLASVRFSIDGATRETFERVRRQEPANPWADPAVHVGYAAVHAAVLRFCELRRERDGGPRVGVRITDFAATRDELEAYRAYWEQRVDFVECARLLSWAGEVGTGAAPGGERHPCMALWNQLVVAWNGDVLPCCVYVDARGEGRGILDEVRTRRLADAAYAPALERVRLAHLEGHLERDAAYCVGCADWRSPSPLGERVWTTELRAGLAAASRSRLGDPDPRDGS